MRIPEQLQGWRFIKLKPRDKIPIEPKWTTTATYGYSDSGLLEHIGAGGNYGVLGSEDHVIVDGDTPEIQQAVEGHLPLTFTVRTPGHQGRHYYFLCKLERPIRLRDKNKVNVGDIQGIGKQVVGPNCIHPNGKTYEVVNDRPPNWIASDDLKRALKEFIIKEPPVEEFAVGERAALKKEGLGSDITITNVHSPQGMIRRGDEYEGIHPVHGSAGGHNFSINPIKNVWVCRRHDTGGGPLSLLAVKEGIIKCEDAAKGALRGETFGKVLELACSKGLLEQSKDPVKYFTLKENGKINKFVPGRLGEDVKKDFQFATMKDDEEIYVYREGVYQRGGEVLIKEVARKRLTNELAREGYINEAVAHVRETTYVDRDEFDNPYNLMAVENGLLDVLTGELQPHTPEKMVTTKLPVFYNKAATCPKIKKFLSEIHYEADIPIIQEGVGYCLLKRYPFGKAFMLLGPGENGKSTMLNLIEKFLGGKNVATPSLQDLLYNRFSKAELYGKLANLHADIPSTKLEKTGAFKMLTGQDTLYMERKNRDPFYGKNHAKLMYSANELPETTDLTLAFFRRWILIRYPNSFPEGGPNTDPHIIEKLTMPEELSGFLNWALEGLHRLLKQGYFTRTKTRKQIEDEWIMKTDSLRAFTNELIRVKQGTFTTKIQFNERYKKFCADNDLVAVTMSAVGHRLPTIVPQTGVDFKPVVDGKQQKSWKDIYITDSTEVLSYSNSNQLKNFIKGITEKNRPNGDIDLGEVKTLPSDIQGCPGALDILSAIVDGAPWQTYKIPSKANVPKRICFDTIAELDRKGYVELSEWEDKPSLKITEKGKEVVK